ncbi:MAG: hypothetical protein ACJ8FY_01725 [Gemmataceae bacterium]
MKAVVARLTKWVFESWNQPSSCGRIGRHCYPTVETMEDRCALATVTGPSFVSLLPFLGSNLPGSPAGSFLQQAAFVQNSFSILSGGAPLNQTTLNNAVIAETSGAATRAQTLSSIVNTPAFANQEVTGFFQTLLGRPPSAADLALFSGQLQSGTAPETVVQNIAAANSASLLPGALINTTNPAILASSGTTAGQLSAIDAAFLQALGRQPSPIEQTNFLNQLQSGQLNTLSLSQSLLGSNEFLLSPINTLNQPVI